MGILPKGAWIVIGMVIVALSVSRSYAQELSVSEGATVSDIEKETLEIEVEHFAPMRATRQIETESITALKKIGSSDNDHISYYAGLTLTYAWGQIIRDRSYDCSAYGLGPVVLWRYTPVQRERWSLAFDFSGGFIFYSEDFPPGGDFYNFMWRIGPRLTYRIRENLSMSIGYKLMHVSNGQQDHNPAYDARGPLLGVILSF